MDVIKAKKENKVYTIDEQQRKRYLAEGYDIYDGEGNILEHSPKKKVSYTDYAAAVSALETLRVEMGNLQENTGEDNPDVVEILKVYAEEHGIDLGKSTSISGIVKKIKESAPKEGE